MVLPRPTGTAGAASDDPARGAAEVVVRCNRLTATVCVEPWVAAGSGAPNGVRVRVGEQEATVDLQQDAQLSTGPPEAMAGARNGDPGIDDAALEAAIGGVPGIAAAAVHRDPGHGHARLRLRLQAGEDRERVAWAVAAVLRERFGIALDPAAIQPVLAQEPRTAQPATPPVPPAIVAADGAATAHRGRERERVTITGLDLHRAERQLRVTVGLRGPAGRADGVARAVPTSQGQLRAVAEATAQALGQLLRGPVDVAIDGVDLDQRAEPPRVTVGVTLLAGRGEEPLLGVAVVREDLERAVVRATLDALNRRVAPLLAAAGAPASPR